MQTMGSLLPLSDDQRRVTRLDAVMTLPFAS
jgi:flagellar motor switch protein FliM